jgi:hypothetical protein
MKMKKTFKFLMCAAIVVAGFTACSEEVTPIDGGNPNVNPVTQGEETTATFAFHFNGSSTPTKALDQAPSGAESKNVTEFRVLLFDAVTGIIDLDTVKVLTSSTVPADSLMVAKVMSGQKYVYVIANDGASNTSVMGLPAKGSVGSFISGAFNPEFVAGSNTTTPDLAGLRTLLGTKFVYSSTTLATEHAITLTPGRTAAQSQTPGDVNYFPVSLDRVVAKVAITKTSPSGPQTGYLPAPPTTIVTKDTTGSIDPDKVTYHIWGANVKTFPFQKWTGTTLVTPSYTPTGKTDTETLNRYVRKLGSGPNNDRISVKNGTPSANDFYYIPENNPTDRRRGNITIAAVEAAYLPLRKFYITDVNYNDAQQRFGLVEPIANITTPVDFFLFNLDGVSGLPQNTRVASPTAATSKQVAKKILYHLRNRTAAELANLAAYDAAIPDDAAVGIVTDLSTTTPSDTFTYYKGGMCYYRLVIGEQNGGAGTAVDPIIRRNYYYDANITGFAQLGENSPNKLVEPEDQQEQGETYLSVHIVLRDWTGRQIGVEI